MVVVAPEEVPMLGQSPILWAFCRHNAGKVRILRFVAMHEPHEGLAVPDVMSERWRIVEQVRTLAANDAYAAGGGYLSGRDMKLIVMHSEHGEVARTTCGIDMLREAV